MSFPFETEENIAFVKTKIPEEYGIDFKTGELTGRIVKGIEAIKVWIYLALHTERYKHVIYSWDYGSETESLIGKSYTQEFLEMELPRMIEDCLSVNSYITSLSDFSITLEDDKLTGSFLVHTSLGDDIFYL